MRTVTIATFNDRDHAQPVVNRLQQAGLHPKLHDETRWQKAHFSETLAGVKVQVEENEFEDAMRRLKELNASEHVLDQAMCCPECGSPDIEYPQVTRKFILPSLHAWIYKLGLAEKEFYCQNCHNTWPMRDKVEPERDILGWPIKGGRRQHNPETTP